MKQHFSRPTWNHFQIFGINLWSWPWNYWKVQVDTSLFTKIWDCWIAVRWIDQLGGGCNLEIATIFEKIPEEWRFNESVESKNFIWFVGMIINPFLFLTFLKFHQFGSTVLPESLLEYVWYAGRRSLERNSYGSRPWAGGQNRRVRIPPRKGQREGDDLAPNWVQFPKTADGQFKFIGRKSGSEKTNFDRVLSKFEEKFKKTFLDNQTGFHQPPKQEVITHQHKRYTEISDILTKNASNFFGKACHDFLQKIRLTPSITGKPVANVVPGLSTTSSLSSSSGTSPPTSLPQESTFSTSDSSLIECESVDEQARGDPSRNPTNLAMLTSESQRTKVES